MGGKSASIRVMHLLRVGVQTECDKWIQAVITVQQIFKSILLPPSTLIVEAPTFGKAQEKKNNVKTKKQTNKKPTTLSV